MTNWKKNINIFLVTTFFQWFYVVIGVWVLYWRTYLTWEQIGLVTAISLAVQLGLELPSGALADMVGRKNTVIFGRFLGVVGFTIFIFAKDFPMFVLANSLYLANWAFESGALSALLFDSLKENGKEKEYYQKTEATGFFYATIGMAVASVLGGILYNFDPRLPYIVTTGAAIIAFLTSFWLEEPTLEKATLNISGYVRQNIEGVFHIFRYPLIRSITVFSISIDFVAYVGLWYLYEPRIAEAGFPATWLGILVAGTYLSRALGTKLIKYMMKLKDNEIPIALTLLQAFGSLLSFWETKTGAISSVYLRKFSDGFRYPILSRLQNDEIHSKYRATSLSAISMISNVFIASAGPVIGIAISKYTVANTLGFMGVFGIVVVLPSAIAVSRQISAKKH